MSVASFLDGLSAQGVEIWAEDGRLRYRAPEKTLTPETISKLRERKEDILAHLGPSSQPARPLTYGQRALWFLHKLNPGSAAYNVAFALTIHSKIDAGVLRRSFQRLIDRHSLLQSTFEKRSDIPVLIARQNQSVAFVEVDASAWNQADLRQRVQETADQPFDLENGPVFRPTLFSSLDRTVLLLSVHHIVCDAWSLRILMDDLRVIYSAEQQGAPCLLPPAAQYAEHVRRERQALAGPEGERLWEFWQNELIGLPFILPLPTDAPFPPERTGKGGSVRFEIDRELARKVREVARSEGVSLSTLLLAAFQSLLHRYTGQTDILVGTPSSGRLDAESSATVGYFASPIPLHAAFAESPTFRHLLQQVKQTVLRALDHQSYPYPLLVERLRQDRDASRTPLFQALFNLQQFHQSKEFSRLLLPDGDPVQWGNLRASSFEINQQEGQFDIALELLDTGSQMLCVLKYNTDVFDRERIERMSGHYRTLLNSAVDEPARRIADLALLTVREQQQLFFWNQTTRPYEGGESIVDRLEKQVRLNPGAPALWCDGGQLSYGEFNGRVNQLAHLLRSLGVGPEARVGICLPRSIAMVEAIYATLKASGAYVPLDPEYPAERLQYMVQDAQVHVLITEEQFARQFANLNDIALLLIDREQTRIGRMSRDNPERIPSENNLAYIIYTSGSTGRPKGAMNEHRAVINRIEWMQDSFNLGRGERVLHKTPISFDVSVWELFWPLSVGATMVIAKPGGHRDSAYLVDLIRKQAVTTVHFVPAMLRLFVEEPGVESCTSLQRVFASGEALPYELKERFYQRCSGLLHNLYGPTEAAVDVSSWTCERGGARNLVPIGRPIANLKLHVLDSKMGCVPIGIAGELYIGGIGVGRGYWRRPALTAERFIPDAISGGSGDRLYRTGDLARWLDDGNLEYLGRIDQQVKLRGIRIELGDVEAALDRLPGVQESVALIREIRPGEPRLVGYIAGPNGVDPRVHRDRLREILPESMVPSTIVHLSSFPLTPNGKIDRKALPDPAWTRSENPVQSSSTATEKELINIWKPILGLAEAGVRDHFFHSGGHSLLATQLISRIRDIFSVEVPLRQFFASPTIAETAAWIDAHSGPAGTDTAIPIANRDLPLPLSFAQQRLWFLCQLEPGNPFYNIAEGLQLDGVIDMEALEWTFNEIVKRHEALRTRIVEHGGNPFQQIVPELAINLQIVDLSAEPDPEFAARQKASEEARRPFDLANLPLLRTIAYRLHSESHLLLFLMHHIVADGWSMGIFVQEIAPLYEAAKRRTSSPLSPLRIQYVDFAVWQRKLLAGPEFQRQLDYWKQQLNGMPELLELPADRARPEAQTYRGATVRFSIDKNLTATLRSHCRDSDATLFMVLLSAFATLLAKYSGRFDLVIATPIANRNRTETEALIGLFVNTLLLRLRLSRELPFRELLGRVRNTALEAYAHQDLPFEYLVDVLRPQRSLSYNALAQVMFVLQNAPVGDLVLDGLQTARVQPENTTSKFDLTLSVLETGDELQAELEYNSDLFEHARIDRMAGHFCSLVQRIVEDSSCPLSQLQIWTGLEQHQMEWADGAANESALPVPSSRKKSGSYSTPRMPREEVFSRLFRELLGMQRVSADDNFFELGGDSILSIRLVSHAKAEGLSITPRQVFQHQTVSALAAAATPDASSLQSKVEQREGPAPLLPIQNQFFEKGFANHFNQSVLLECPADLNPDRLETSLAAVVSKHPALRTRYFQGNDGWRQEVLPNGSVKPQLQQFDFADFPEDEAASRLTKEAACLQGELRPAHGQLLRAAWFNYGTHRKGRLLLVVHHLSVDAISWLVLTEDLVRAYESANAALESVPQTTSHPAWAERLAAHAQTDEIVGELGFWESVCKEAAPIRVDAAVDAANNTVAEAQKFSTRLTSDETSALLESVPSAYHTQINDALLTCLALAVQQWRGDAGPVLIDLEGHGREDLFPEIDLSRTVGWFTTIFPVRLDPGDNSTNSIGTALKQIKEQLRTVPHRGIGYGLLRHLNPETRSKLESRQRPEIRFNYLGRVDNKDAAVWPHAPESSGPWIDGQRQRDHLIEIDAAVVAGSMHLNWTWSRRSHQEETIVALSTRFVELVHALIRHCAKRDTGSHTPSDFPLIAIDQIGIDAMEGRYPAFEDILPLSPMQAGLLVHALEDRGRAYQIQSHLQFEGGVDTAVLKTSWQLLFNRHEALRTAIVTDWATPFQITRRMVDVPWSELDWASESESQFDLNLKTYLAEDWQLGFNLASDPLLRVAVIRRAAGRFVMILSAHHLIVDGWSWPVLLKELFQVYSQNIQGRALDLPPVRRYRDYLRWLKAQPREPEELFWRQRLKGFDTPVRFSLPVHSPGNGTAEHWCTLSAEATARIQKLAGQQHVTLNVAIQAAWGLLLSRYSGAHDLTFGVTAAGRPSELSNVEHMIGLFINTVPVRMKIDEHMPVSDWLSELQQAQAEQQGHEYSHLIDIQKWSELPAGQALFDTMMSFQNFPVDAGLLDGTTAAQAGWRITDVHTVQHSHYALGLLVASGRQLTIRLSYDRARFDEDSAKQIVGHLESILLEMSAHPEWPLVRLNALTANDSRKLLNEWNATSGDYPRIGLHSQFEQQVQKTPNATALEFEGEELTFLELNARANQLARHLQSLQVGRGDLVGICIERSFEMVTSILAILKTGAAYVPVEPSYPDGRIADIVRDSRLVGVVTSHELSLRFHHLAIEVIDIANAAIERNSSENFQCESDPEDLAYVIYTSGSTGQPKGVMQTHRALSNHMAWMQQRFPLLPSDRVLQKTAFSFDASVWEFYAPLLTGARLVLARPDGQRDASYLARTILDSRITTLQLVPSQLRALLDAMNDEEFLGRSTHLRHVYCGGEPLEMDLVHRFRRLINSELINLYGPTEACIDSTYSICRPKDAEPSIPIGRPIWNTKIYLLDEYLRPAPQGVVGDLYIAGSGLARGYLHKAAATSETFVPNPFSSNPGERMYRTGDLARYRADGALEFLGRRDHQIKLRGHRIELGEIESTLKRCSGVQQAVAAISDDRLIAYFVAEPRHTPEPEDLRTALLQVLPEYMVPAVFLALDSFPLMPNGKVDRRRVTALPLTSQQIPDGHVPPQTPSQQVITEIWAAALRVDAHKIGIHDSFFALGGHSLIATQIVMQIRKAFSVELRLRGFFDAPTIAGLDQYIRAQRGKGLPVLPPIDKSKTAERSAPLSFAQQRIWFLDRFDQGGAGYNIPTALRIEGPLDFSILEASLSAVTRRHDILRTVYRLEDEQPTQIVLEPEPESIHLIKLQSLDEESQEAEVDRLLQSEACGSFQLDRDRPIRVTAIRLTASLHVVAVIWHHIASDAISSEIFSREITRFYESFIAKQACDLPGLPVQYADYARWQAKWLNRETLQPYLDHFRKHLGGAAPVLPLPFDRPRPPKQTFNGARESFLLPNELTKQLIDLSRESQATLFMTLLAGFAALLSRYSGLQDIVIGSPTAARDNPEVQDLIGVFLNNLVLRVDLSGEPNARELVRRIRTETLDAYTHQDLPFELLVDALQPERNLSYSPVFQVMFSMQEENPEPIRLPGLTLTAMPIERKWAKYDLTLYMRKIGSDLSGEIEYNTDLFDGKTIRRMAGHYRSLLKAMVEAPGQPVGNHILLTDGEREQILRHNNQTSFAYDQALGVADLVALQSQQNPDAVAIIFGDRQLSYRQLNARVNQVARHLIASGVGPDSLVAICLERSLDLVIAMLGVLKAGGAYLPLDPSYPNDRLTYMLADANVELLITTLEHSMRFAAGPVRLQYLDDPAILNRSQANIASTAAGENLAYVIYTSGSTGRPKGVQITRRSLTNFLLSMAREPGIQHKDVLLAVTTPSFDIAGLEIFLPLISGATLVIAHDAVIRDGRALIALLIESRATIMQATPATWRLLLESGLESNPRLKMLCGGEALGHDLALALRVRGGELWNLYGPTETTIWSSLCALQDGDSQKTIASIGRPIANTQLYILDAAFHLQPIGVPGDLWIGGDGLARGYHDQPGMTAHRFVPDPFSKVPGARLYRTGDLARMLPNGEVEWVGRADSQIKLRGHRIELSEIDAVLSSHSTVKQVVTIIRGEDAQHSRLISYIVPEDSLSFDENALRRHAESKLPRYMAPSAFVCIDQLPLTPNGKVDRRALPAPETSVSKMEVTIPRDDVEASILRTWRNVLGLDSIGLDQNFFDVGGHSLLMVRVQARLQDELNRDISIVELFEHTSIIALAEHLNAVNESTTTKAPERGQLQCEALERRRQLRVQGAEV